MSCTYELLPRCEFIKIEKYTMAYDPAYGIASIITTIDSTYKRKHNKQKTISQCDMAFALVDDIFG